MPTVIDSLVVRLGLDAGNYRSGLRRSVDDTRQTGADIGRSLEATTRSAASALASIGRAMAGMGVIVGLKRISGAAIDLGANLHVMGAKLGINSAELNAWGNAAVTVGGTAEGLQSSMASLAKAQADMLLTGQSDMLPYLYALGVSLADASGKARPVTDILEDLADRLSKMDPKLASHIAPPGIDQGTITLLMRGRSELNAMLAAQKEHGLVSAKQAEQAFTVRKELALLKQGFGSLGRTLVSGFSPAITQVVDALDRLVMWLGENKAFVQGLATVAAAIALMAAPISITVIAITAIAVAIAALWDDIQTFRSGGESLIDWGKWIGPMEKVIDIAKILGEELLELGIIAIKELYKAFLSLSGWMKEHPKTVEAGLAIISGALVAITLSALPMSAAFWGIVAALAALAAAIAAIDFKRWKSGISSLFDWGSWEEYDKLKSYLGDAGGKVLKWFSPAEAEASVAPSKMPTGPKNPTEAEAVKFFEAQGWQRDKAIAIVSNLVAESGLNPNAVGDGGKAYGAAQWHPDRQAEFARVYGKSIIGTTLQEQLAFVQYELTHGKEQTAGESIKGANGVYESVLAVMRKYERAQFSLEELQRRLSIARQVQARTEVPGGTSRVANNTINVGEVNINTTAQDAGGIAQDINRELQALAAQSIMGMQ